MDLKESFQRVIRNMSYGSQKVDLNEEGTWAVYGEDPNCDLGGSHHEPFLGTIEGRLEDAINEAIKMPGFWQWGSGGRLKKTNTVKLTKAEPQEVPKKRKETLKIGIDLHGVATDAKEFFVEFTRTMVQAGHEVHIITGPRVTDKLKQELKDLGLYFTHLFSITDYHLAIGTKIEFDARGNPFMDDYLWDRTKADYCLREGISIHFDDSDAYNYFFKTPYARFYSKTKRTHYVKSH